MIDAFRVLPATGLGVLLATSAMLLFAVCVIITSVASRRLDSDCGSLLSAGVNLPVGLILVGIQLSTGAAMIEPTRTGVLAFVLAGIFSTYLGRWLLFKSIETMGPTRASGFQSSSPLLTALIGWLLLGEQLGWAAWGGMALGVVGLALMSRRSVNRNPLSSPQRLAEKRLQRGILVLGLGASAAYAVSHVLRAAGVRDWGEPLVGTTLGAAAGLSVLLLVNAKRLASISTRVAANRGSAALYCAVGVMQFAAQALMIASMKYIPASFAALITMCTPLVVLPVSFVLLRNEEAINSGTVLGMLVTIVGIVLLTWRGLS